MTLREELTTRPLSCWVERSNPMYSGPDAIVTVNNKVVNEWKGKRKCTRGGREEEISYNCSSTRRSI